MDGESKSKPEERGGKFAEAAKAVEELLASNNADKALTSARKLERDFGDIPEFCLLMGKCLQMGKTPRQALVWYRKAVSLNPNLLESYRNTLVLCEQLGETDPPIDLLWEGALRAKDRPMFYVWLEAFLIHHQDEKRAAEVVEKANRQLDKGELCYLRGRAAIVLRLYPSAIDLFRSSISQGYTGRFHYYFLALAFGYCDYLEHAKFFLKLSLQSEPEDRDAIDEFTNLLLWREKSGDEKPLEALSWRRSELASDLRYKTALRYLDTPAATLKLSYESLIEIDDTDLSVQLQEIFAEFYADLLLTEKRDISSRFDPLTSLKECILKLEEFDADLSAKFYSAWYAFFTDDLERSRSLFSELKSDWLSLSHKMQNGILSGLARMSEDSPTEAEEPPSTDIDSKLARYGTTLTLTASGRGKKTRHGLEQVVAKMIAALASSNSSGIVLTGPSGVGKTATIKELARFLLGDPTCPESLKGLRVFQTSTGEIMSGAKYLGMWQERVLDLCTRCCREDGYLLYVNDLANLFGAGRSEGDTSRMADLFLPRMENGQIVVLGEMEPAQAQQLFAQEPRFERVVTQIEVSEPGTSDLPAILTELASGIGETEGVEFTPEAISEVIDLSRVFVPYKAFPGKANGILRAAGRAFTDGKSEETAKVDGDEIILAFCEMSGIPEFIVDPHQPLDQERMREFFVERILGQDEAIANLTGAVTLFKARLCDPAKPIRSFLFVGPTGVGKTESAKVLAEYLFGSQEKIIRVNMSEYSGGDAVSRLIGADSGNELKTSKFLDQVRKNPFSVVLLDEIEKANPEVFNLLLQLLDDGVLTDAAGKSAHFQSAIIIMTSNIGSRHYTAQSIGFGSESRIPEVQSAVLQEVMSFFTPEVYNRFDEVLCFKPLNREVLSTIVNREIGKVLERQGVARSGIPVELDPPVRDFILRVGYDPKYGARHIKRAVERAVALPLARLFTSQRLTPNTQVRINMVNHEPVANRVDLQEFEDQQIALPEEPQFSVKDIRIPDRKLMRTIESLESRIIALKEKFRYDETLREYEELQETMGRPNFWDDQLRANALLRRFAEINRRLERIHRWQRAQERIAGALAQARGKAAGAELGRVRSNLIGLIKDLESAEMEMLLEGKFDYADAFLMISTTQMSESALKWMLELVDVYSRWARHRGYHCRTFGEQPDLSEGKRMILLHLGGLNAFGLLKNERGIHRKSISARASAGKQGGRVPKKNLDCNVCVLADVQPLDREQPDYEVSIAQLKPVNAGWKLKKLSRSVSLNDPSSGTGLRFLSDNTIDADDSLPGDLFLSYLHFQQRAQNSASAGDKVWGSLVRSLELGERSRVVDYRTKIVIQNVKDYLNGKIDPLLLERLV